MENTLPSPTSASNTGRFLLPVLLAAILSAALYQTYNHAPQPPRDRTNMEKSSGKNDKHSSPKARQGAEEQYQKARNAWQQLKSKANKSPEDKQLQQQLEKQVKHLEKKKGWKGENHSQKHKGN